MNRDELREAVAQQVETIIAREVRCGQDPALPADDQCKTTWLPYKRHCPECPLHHTQRADVAREMADAALAVALPILQQHYAEVAEDASGSMGPVIAAAIRADEGPK